MPDYVGWMKTTMPPIRLLAQRLHVLEERPTVEDQAAVPLQIMHRDSHYPVQNLLAHVNHCRGLGLLMMLSIRGQVLRALEDVVLPDVPQTERQQQDTAMRCLSRGWGSSHPGQ